MIFKKPKSAEINEYVKQNLKKIKNVKYFKCKNNI